LITLINKTLATSLSNEFGVIVRKSVDTLTLFLGAKVVAVRIAVSLFFPLLAGWLCENIWDRLNV